jgi:glycosyltransferase involved in cell wall biosynthesis
MFFFKALDWIAIPGHDLKGFHIFMIFPPSQKISVIIPVHNGGKQFARCLDSLQLCSPSPLEIIVVADGESDGSWRLALAKGHRTVLLERQSGPAAARNTGAKLAKGEILLFLDADVLVKPNLVADIEDFFDRHRSHAALIGSYDAQPLEKNLISQYRNLLHHFIHQNSREEAQTFWGACGAIRKTIFLAIGGFDAKYRTASIEDIEMGYRLVHGGHQIKLAKNIQVTHQKKWKFLNMLETDVFRRAIPWSYLLLKGSHIPNDLNLSLSARLSTVLAFVLLFSPLLWFFSKTAFFLIMSGASVLFILVNRAFYTFLLEKRGKLFLLKALPLHWLYYIYSGLSYGTVLAKTKFLKFQAACRLPSLFPQ